MIKNIGKKKTVKSTYCVVELAQSIGPAGSQTGVGDSGVAAVQVVEPGAQLLVYSQLKIVEGFLAMRKLGGLF